MRFRAVFQALLADDGAAALVEYALVLAVLSAGAVTILYAFGASATTVLDRDGQAIQNTGENPP